ncbi:hypothetical protein HDV03_000526 [Kappamyces sp. JEL0829]|nr:hypothetical protein HDV03_000526 [Kappamyces sp. JEL0829]
MDLDSITPEQGEILEQFQALERAKQNLQYLLVVLQSDLHDETRSMAQGTLTNDSFLSYLTEKNILVWGGNIRESEAFKVAAMLGATRYPFMALIAYHDSKMKVVHRFFGVCPPEECIDVFTRVANQLDRNYAAIRAERFPWSPADDRAERDAGRSIREQQDAAYQLSLQADREKAALLKKEAEEKRQRELQAEQALQDEENRRQAKRERKIELASALVPEPPANAKAVTRINIRLPSGERIIRRFDATKPIQLLYDFIETKDLDPIDLLAEFVVVNTYPRKEYPDRSKTFQETGLFPNATVLVEEVVEAGSDDE